LTLWRNLPEASRNKRIKEKIRRVAPPPPVKFEQLLDTIFAIVAKGCPEVGPALFNPLCKSHCIATLLSGCPLFICFDDGLASPNVTENTKTTRSRRGGSAGTSGYEGAREWLEPRTVNKSLMQIP
jgi:hypothetical protein